MLGLLGFGQLGALGHAGNRSVAPPTNVLRAVSSLNRIPDATQALAAGHTAWTVSHPHYIGSGPVASIAILLNFWAMSANGTTGGTGAVLAIGNSGTIEQAFAFCNGVQVPILFAGGATSLTWADLDADVVSQELTASQFGLSQFTPGTKIDILMRGTVASAALRIPSWGVDQNRFDAGFQAASFNPANTTATATGGTWSFTGTAPTGLARAFAVCLVGKFASGDPKTVLWPGDSIIGGTFDVNWAGGVTPRGLGMRTLLGTGGSNRMAGIIAAINGGNLGPWFAATNTGKLFSITKYCNIVVCEHLRNVVSLTAGGPNIFPTGETSVRNSFTSSWTRFRAAAATGTGLRPLRIARMENSVRLGAGSTTGSSPDTAAAALGTQTPLNTPWGLGGDAKKLSDWIATQVGNGVGPDVLWDQSALVRASTDPANADYYKVPAGVNFDGVHWGYLSLPAIAADLRARIEALP